MGCIIDAAGRDGESVSGCDCGLPMNRESTQLAADATLRMTDGSPAAAAARRALRASIFASSFARSFASRNVSASSASRARRLGGEFGEGRFRRRVAIRQRGERNVVVRLPIRLGILRRGFVVLRDVSVGVGGDRLCLLRLHGVGEERLVHDGERRFDGNLHRRLLFTAALGRGGVETRAAATTTSRGGDSLRALGAFALLPTHPLVPEHELIFAGVGVVSFVVLREISRAAAELRARARGCGGAGRSNLGKSATPPFRSRSAR